MSTKAMFVGGPWDGEVRVVNPTPTIVATVHTASPRALASVGGYTNRPLATSLGSFHEVQYRLVGSQKNVDFANATWAVYEYRVSDREVIAKADALASIGSDVEFGRYADVRKVAGEYKALRALQHSQQR